MHLRRKKKEAHGVKKFLESTEGTRGEGGWGAAVSAGELPLVSFAFVDVLEEFGFAAVFRLLVPEAAAAASLLQLHAFAAVHV